MAQTQIKIQKTASGYQTKLFPGQVFASTKDVVAQIQKMAAASEVKFEKTASGYKTQDLPGQIFKTEAGLRVALAKKKGKPTNPWAVCTKSVGRDDKEKYEKCVMDVKEKSPIKED